MARIVVEDRALEQQLPSTRESNGTMGKSKGRRRRGRAGRESILVGNDEYVILDRLKDGVPGRLKVLDRDATPDGELRCILLLPHSDNLVDRLSPLVRASQHNFAVPIIIKCVRRKEDVAVVCNWIRGTPLDKHLEKLKRSRRGRVSPYEATRLYFRFVHGLCSFHTRCAAAHGDISPKNLILSDANYLVLIDFGTAWALENMADYDPTDKSTPPYTAPEVLQGGNPTFASDQFSATVVYYQLLTGRIPHDGVGGIAGTNPSERVRYEPPSRLASRGDSTPRRFWRQIDAIVKRGLQFDPLKRYPSKHEWLDDIDELWHGFKMEPRVTRRNEWLGNLIERASRLFRRTSLLG
jgi:serine/threonine protein kinase